MIPIERGSASKPVFVALSAARPSLKDSIGMIAITVLPVALAILMQKPALRQALVMKATHFGKEFCAWQGEFWNGAAANCATAYNKARM